MPYFVGGLALCVLWVVFGVASGWNVIKLFEGADGRPSTSKFQFWLWTIVVIFAYSTIYAMKVSTGHFEAITDIPNNVLIAMGMSIASATAAKSITASYVSSGRLTKTAVPSGTVGIGALFQDDTAFPDLSKVQIIAWTLIAIATYLVAVVSKVHSSDFSKFPDIDTSLMVLMGLGHGAYLGKKLTS